MSVNSLSSSVPRSSGRIARPKIDSITLAILTALYLIAFTNRTFFSRAFEYFDNHLALLAFSFGLTCLFAALAIAFSVKYLIKPVLILMILSAASAAWFMDQFGAIIDVNMIRNAAITTSSEAGHLITPAFLLHMAVFGILPSLLVCWVKVQHRNFLAKLRWNLTAIVPLVLIGIACGISSARSIASVTRIHKDLILTFNPLLPIGNAVGFVLASEADRNIVAAPLGTDAKVAGPTPSGKPRVLVIVTGETARAENFSLGGYGRETNPELKKRDITYFSQVSSCGTATAVSVPCMFSNLKRSGYSHRAGLASENLLDVLGHAGITTEWWENNTGSQNVANRTVMRSFSNANDPRFCKSNECLDDAMIDQLDTWLSNIKGDSVLVLHQLGSHGPAYYQRYTPEFARFTPECSTAEIGNCDRQSVVNTYDNTILYTDHILASVIDKLKARENSIDPAMIYMSDHGESLGENGLYLHGAPYIIAPSQQTHVPFVLWQGAEMKASVDAGCLTKRAGEEASHDNLFHTALGMMAVKTSVYTPQLDVLSACRTPASGANS
ncbi:phosphoethanolamine--lipid A transferase [Neorhizobium sp. JUb45]|uniref:phosphoethanolamine transferase n=1 Tax=unclassified Neorhizobium TaxID=2629175 RepID=UPI00104F04A3|nr:phosphoethanolamine--lipid A transferase [Neorhizobium sp. JUb45]TCR00017.1 phosphatidylethanolamine:Kdo2-lipid A phosphoethanolamine transferase [Neorhizobium sp. JUb45]